MTCRSIMLLAGATLLLGTAPARPGAVRYTLAPVMRQGRIEALAVTMRFAALPSGVTKLSWPDEWAGEHRLGQWARNLVVLGARRVETGADGTRTILSRVNAPITVRYDVVSAYAADPSVADTRQPAPVVRPNWFYAVGDALFARPEGEGDDDRSAIFRWAGSAGIGFASDLEHAGGKLTLKDITESVVIGGNDLHVTATGSPGHQLRVARIGRYAFDGSAFDALALRVIQAERDFWRARDEGPFLVTMMPVASRPGHLSYSGTGRDDAFALWMDTSAPLDRLAWLLGHEYFHTWNPRRLGRSLPAPQERGYWFSEGLTDFYASRLMLRAGLISPDQFVAFWNEKLLRYAGSRFRTATNDVVATSFWSDEQADAMQYQRGAFLAVLWDRRLRSHHVTDGLDGVLRKQAKHLLDLSIQPTAIDLFVATTRAAGLDIRPDIAAHIDRGEPLLLPQNSFGSCLRVVTEERSAFERGWNVAATEAAGNVVTRLDPASPAYAAGLRDGMKILARVTGTPDDARVDYTLKVADGSSERVIRFRPAGRTRITTQELVLDRAAFAVTPETCRRSMTE